MSKFKIHIMHVGDMTNKGTEALIRSDISLIKDILGNTFVNVSTTDVEGMECLKIPCDSILPTMVDIPYTFADRLAKRLEITRDHIQYKAFAVVGLIFMFIQTIILLLSAFLIRLGFRGFYRNEVLQSIKSCDIVISCSDENFKETASLLPLNIYWIVTWWSMLFERTLEISVARFLRKPIIMFPNSIGPFRTWVGKFLSRLSLNNCVCIMIREPISYGIVNSLDITSKTILTSDTALLYESNKKSILTDYSHPIIGVCPGVYSHSISMDKLKQYISEHAKALDEAIMRHGFDVLFIPHYISGFGYDDLKISKFILQKMKYKDKAKILKLDTVEDFKAILSNMDMIISSKMHPAVLATSSYVPTLCIAYDHKQIGFFDYLNMPYCIIRLMDVSAETLLLKINLIWKSRQKISDLLREHVPEIQENTRNNIKKSLNLLFKDVK